MDSRRFLKAFLGLVVLVALLAVVLSWWGDYRSARTPTSPAGTNNETTSTPTTETASPTAEQTTEPSAEPKTILVVQVSGLNFRQKPSGTSTAYRGLKKGEKVVLLAEEGDWYKVQDANGVVGYVTTNPAYTKKTTE